MTIHEPSLKQRVGCWLHERWRAELVLRAPRLARRVGTGWLDLCNRHERLDRDALSGGRSCRWEYTSLLTVARFFPGVGARLLHHCLAEWPIEFADRPSAPPSDHPDVSVIVGVRGTGRMAQFRATLASLLAQKGCSTEIIVVEQSETAEFGDVLPEGVRYVHTRPPSPDVPYNRSWALNVGARAARGDVLILYDADMLAPVACAAAVAERLSRGADVLRMPRFLFYLDEPSSVELWQRRDLGRVDRVDRVVQNNATPIALTRRAYFALGGHDESFIGWGGEDNEFLDRCATLRMAGGAFLPLVHLWHPEAPNRSGDRNAGHLRQRRVLPPERRIAELCARNWGGHGDPLAGGFAQ